MKLYFLLRNNAESGPYTQKELKEIGLAPSDLLWIEGESTSWQHPTDISGLKNIAKAGILKPLNTPPQTVAESEPSYELFSTNKAFSTPGLQTANNFTAITEEIYPLDDKESFSWEARRPKINAASVANSLFGLGVLMVGVMLFAFVIKKLVDHFEYEPQYATSEAIEISTEQLPVNTTSHAAMGVLPTTPIEAETLPTDEVPSAAMPNPIADVAKSENVQKSEAQKINEEGKTDILVTEPEAVIPAEVKEEKKVVENETKPVIKAAPALSVSANDYKVGMFGGVSDLEITVNNPSSINIDKAIVEVEFLKPNGSVVKSQIVTIENIAPGGTKKVPVPASSRGVKVRYRVVSTDVQDGKVVSNDI